MGRGLGVEGSAGKGVEQETVLGAVIFQFAAKRDRRRKAIAKSADACREIAAISPAESRVCATIPFLQRNGGAMSEKSLYS